MRQHGAHFVDEDCEKWSKATFCSNFSDLVTRIYYYLLNLSVSVIIPMKAVITMFVNKFFQMKANFSGLHHGTL